METETEAARAIKWTCVHCGYEQYTDDTLEQTEIDYVRADNIFCCCCGEDNRVVLQEI